MAVRKDTKEACMDKLEKENAILRFKLREVASVTNILTEAKEQISQLETRNAELAKSLGDLQTWAATQDKIMLKGRMSVDKKDRQSTQLDKTTMKNLSIELRRSLAEYFLPVEEGSAQDLREENKKLRERIETLQSTSDVNKENKKLLDKIDDLEQTCKEKDRKIVDLTQAIEQYERIMKIPEHAKDIELFRLRKILDETKDNAKENHLHRALNNETSQLKGKLESTLNMCQVLANKLDGNVTTRRSRTPRKDASPHPSADSTSPTRNGTAPMPSLPENQDYESLKQELKDVLEKNTRWQIYNNQREEYVHSLLQKYNDLNTRLQQTQEMLGTLRSNPGKLSEEQRRYFDSLLVQARQELTVSRNETIQVKTELEVTKKKMEEEVAKIKRELEHWRSRYEEQREVNARLHAECESERRRSNCSTQENKEKRSQIELLTRQVEMYCEDFRAERKEKEDLRREVKHLQREILNMKSSVSKKSGISFNEYDINMQDEIQEYSAKPARQTVHKYAVSPPKQMRKHVSPYRENHFESANRTDALHDKTNKAHPSTSRPSSSTRRQAPPIPTRNRSSEVSKSRAASQEKSRRKSDSKDSRTYSRGLYEKTDKLSHCDDNMRSRRKNKSITEKYSDMLEESANSRLTCPNCGKVYPIDEHLLLLSHIDNCGE